MRKELCNLKKYVLYSVNVNVIAMYYIHFDCVRPTSVRVYVYRWWSRAVSEITH